MKQSLSLQNKQNMTQRPRKTQSQRRSPDEQTQRKSNAL